MSRSKRAPGALMHAEEAARVLGLAPKTIVSWIDCRELPGVVVKGRYYAVRAAVEKMAKGEDPK